MTPVNLTFSILDLQNNEFSSIRERIFDITAHLGRRPKPNEEIDFQVWMALPSTDTMDAIRMLGVAQPASEARQVAAHVVACAARRAERPDYVTAAEATSTMADLVEVAFKAAYGAAVTAGCAAAAAVREANRKWSPEWDANARYEEQSRHPGTRASEAASAAAWNAVRADLASVLKSPECPKQRNHQKPHSLETPVHLSIYSSFTPDFALAGIAVDNVHTLMQIDGMNLARLHLTAAQGTRGGTLTLDTLDAHRRLGEAFWARWGSQHEDQMKEVPRHLREIFAEVFPGHIRV